MRSYVKMKLLLYVTVSIMFLLSGCSDVNNVSANVKKARNQFKEIIEEFDEQKNEVAEEFQEGKQVLLTFKEAIKKAKDKDAEFAKVHNKWEYIEETVKKLHNKFKLLVQTADNFYAVLEEKANTIQDQDLRAKTLADLNASKQRYIERLKKTKIKINELDTINRKVQDTVTAIEISYSLDILEEELNKTFQEIDRMISSVMAELDKLSKESKALLSQRYGR